MIMEHDGTETEWPTQGPMWTAYMRGWQAGYRAYQQDVIERLTREDEDKIVLKRFAALLADLRSREDGIF